MTEQDELSIKELLGLFIDRAGYDQRHNELLAQVATLQSRVEGLEMSNARQAEHGLTARQLASIAVTISIAMMSLAVTTMLLLVNHILHP